MNIIFEYEGKKLLLPVNPASVKVTMPSQSQKVEVIGIGEVSVPQTRRLATVNISSFFWYDLFNQRILAGLGGLTNALPSTLTSQFNVSTATDFIGGKIAASKFGTAVSSKLGGTFIGELAGGAYSSIVNDSQKFTVLNEYVKWFNEWQASKKPARWTIVVPPNEPPQCYDFYVTCENFSYEIRAGEENDYYYDLELLEWRDYGAKVLTETQTTNADGTKTTKFEQQPNVRLDVHAKIAEKQCTGKDSIWSVSKQWCKNNWKDLLNEEVNKVTLSTSPSILSGLKLKIPTKYT